MNGHFESTKHDIASILALDTSKLQAVLLNVITDLAGQHDHVQKLDKALKEVNGRSNATAFEDSLREHATKVALQQARIEGMERELGERLASVESKISSAAEMEGEVQERLANLERKVNRVGQMETEFEDRCASLENKIKHAEAAVPAMKNGFDSLEGKFNRASQMAESRHAEMQVQLTELRLGQKIKIQEAAETEAEAHKLARQAMEAEERVAAERLRLFKEQQAQLEKERLADEEAEAGRQRKRAEREAQWENERLEEEVAAAERLRKRKEREAQVDQERLADETAAAGRVRVRQQREKELAAAAAAAEYLPKAAVNNSDDDAASSPSAQALEESWVKVAVAPTAAVPAAKVAPTPKPTPVGAPPPARVVAPSKAPTPAPAPAPAQATPPTPAPAVAAVPTAEPTDEDDGVIVRRLSTGVKPRLRFLDNSQKNQHKLCKKKLKEIEGLGAQIDSKTIKFKDLTEDQKEKLQRRKELNDTVAELEGIADELNAQEEAEEKAASEIEEARLAEEARQALMQTPEWKAQNAALVAEQEKQAANRAKEEARLAKEAEAKAAADEAAAVLQAAEEARIAALDDAAKAQEARIAAEKAIHEEHLAAIKRAEDAEAEIQAQLKLRKASIKKLKEIQVQEDKMKAAGQKFDDLAPEVQDKLSKKAELEAQIAEVTRKFGPP